MSDFVGEDDWETVDTSSKKKGKGKSGSSTFSSVELDLQKDSLKSPQVSIQPENKRLVGQYLVSAKKGIFKNRSPDGKFTIRRTPPPQFFKELPGPTKIKPTMASDNPLDQFGDFSMRLARDGLFDPDSVLPTIHLMIGRGCLKKIMKCFDPADPNPHNNRGFHFRIKRQDNYLMIEETEKWSKNVAYGYAFETLMTTCPERGLQDFYFYRNICYELDGLTLLMGFEVDCCMNNPPNYSSVELKSYNNLYEPNWLDYWETLVLSDTRYLCVGGIDKTEGMVCNIVKKQVEEVLPEDHEARRNRFSQLSEVLHWIKGEFDRIGGTSGDLIYHPRENPGKLTVEVKS